MAGIYSDETIYGKPKTTTTTTTSSGGGNLTCEDCDSRFVNVVGDTMTGALSLTNVLRVFDLVENSPLNLVFDFTDGTNSTITYTSDGYLGFIYALTYLFDDDVIVFGDMNATGVVCDGTYCLDDLENYYSSSEIESFGYYNSSNFDITNYYNSTQVDNNFYDNNSNIDATGFNITANYFIGNGSLLTGISAGGGDSLWTNESGTATYDGNANVTGNLSSGSFVIYYE